MELTRTEQEMLDGRLGYPRQKAMEILVQLGEIYGAERMVPVRNVHMPGSSVVVAGKAGTRFVEEMAEKGGKFVTYTTLNPAAGDLDCWEQIGFDSWAKDLQFRLTGAYQAMGAVPCHTCTPYLIGNVPRLGEHVAWGESSAIAFANSVLGARTNREGGPTALAAALAGVVPAYGYHLQSNRRGQVVVRVRVSLASSFDFGTLGYYVGSQTQDRVPVFEGLEADPGLPSLKMLCASLASSGSVALFHVAGVTPEAPTAEAAFGRTTPEVELVYGVREHEETIARLNTCSDSEAGLVVIGCPHASDTEIAQVARLLDGKRVSSNCKLWILTSVGTKAIAQRAGYNSIIERAGGRIVCDTCPVLGAVKDLIRREGCSSISTNSAKLAHYVPGQLSVGVHYGSLEECVAAAVRGRWA